MDSLGRCYTSRSFRIPLVSIKSCPETKQYQKNRGRENNQICARGHGSVLPYFCLFLFLFNGDTNNRKSLCSHEIISIILECPDRLQAVATALNLFDLFF